MWLRGFLPSAKARLPFAGIALLRAGVLAVLVVLALCPLRAAGTVIWNGPLYTYIQANPYPFPDNQDSLTPSVALTRGSTRGLFNSALESSYTHFSSPLNTEWAYGALSNYSALTYFNWEALSSSRPPDMVGKDAVLHLISDDIYLSIQFTSWGVRGSGFSYIRSTPTIPEPASNALLLIGFVAMGAKRFKSRFSTRPVRE